MNTKRTRELPQWWAYATILMVCMMLIVFAWLYYSYKIQLLDRGIVVTGYYGMNS